MICKLIEDNDLDVLAITETWLTPDDSVSAGCFTPAGYQLQHADRKHGIGGGVAVVYKVGFMTRQLELPKTRTFESMGVLVSSDAQSLRLVVIYRPPPNRWLHGLGVSS